MYICTRYLAIVCIQGRRNWRGAQQTRLAKNVKKPQTWMWLPRLLTRTTDAQIGNSLYCTAENSIPFPNFLVQPKHILSATSAHFFRCLWNTPSLGVGSLWLWIQLHIMKTRSLCRTVYSRSSDFPPSLGCESYQASCWITSHCVSSLCRRALLTVWVRDIFE